MSTIKERMSKQTQKVNCTILSQYIAREVDFLKIDVEGVEKDIVEDLKSTGKLQLVKQMVVEYHHNISKDTDALSSFLRLLRQQFRISNPRSFITPL